MHSEREHSKIMTVSTEELESRCLEIIDLVEKKGCTYIITKNGRPFVILKPLRAVSATVNDIDLGAGCSEDGG